VSLKKNTRDDIVAELEEVCSGLTVKGRIANTPPTFNQMANQTLWFEQSANNPLPLRTLAFFAACRGLFADL
jgi:hypothetical protein